MIVKINLMQKILLFTLVLLPVSIFSQTKKVKFISRTTSESGIFLSSNGSLSASALSLNQYWGVGKRKKNFKFGLGARLTSSFGGSSLEYITAPAILTSGQTGPGVFFADQQPKNIDTLSLNSTQINSLNAYLALRYDFAKKWGIEFNIDLAGISLGGSKSASLQYGDGTSNNKTSNAKPTFGNVLLISDNDLGSLNSEFLVSYKIKPKLKIKTGASFLFNEYTLSSPVKYINTAGTTIDTDRYRTKAFMFGLGINYIFTK